MTKTYRYLILTNSVYTNEEVTCQELIIIGLGLVVDVDMSGFQELGIQSYAQDVVVLTGIDEEGNQDNVLASN